MAYVEPHAEDAPMVADASSSMGALAHEPAAPPFDPTLGFGDGVGASAVNLPLAPLPAATVTTLGLPLPAASPRGGAARGGGTGAGSALFPTATNSADGATGTTPEDNESREMEETVVPVAMSHHI